MNKFILMSFLLACIGAAIAGYGSGTPGYYDAWTYYGGYDQYYNRRYNSGGRYQPRPYYPISRYGGSSSYGSRSQPRPYTPIRRYDGYDRASTKSKRGSYEDDRMYDEY